MVFFNIKDNSSGIRHAWFSVRRQLFNLPATYFVDKLNREGLDCEAVKTSSTKDVVCHVCGFSMAVSRLKSGWTIQACSAVNFEKRMRSDSFKKWAETLPDTHRPNTPDTTEAPNLQLKEQREVPVLKASNLPIRLFNNILS